MLGEGAREALYNGIPESEVDDLMTTVIPLCGATAEVAVDFCANDLKIPKTYVYCALDQAVLPAAQDAFTAGTPDMKVVKVETGHFPFITIPKEIAEIIIQASKESVAIEMA